MRKDIDIPKVENVGVAIGLEKIGPDGPEYGVWLLNQNDFDLKDVLVASSGFGEKDGTEVKTSVLRHFLDDVGAKSHTKIETIVPDVFGLNNQYRVTYYVNKVIYDKKFTFLPHTIREDNFVALPGLDFKGVLII
jgi:hypothetical protein